MEGRDFNLRWSKVPVDCWESPLSGLSLYSHVPFFRRCQVLSSAVDGTSHGVSYCNSGAEITCCYGSATEFLFDLFNWLKICFEGLSVDFRLSTGSYSSAHLDCFPHTSLPQMFCTAPPFVRLELAVAEGIPCKILRLSSWFNVNTQVCGANTERSWSLQFDCAMTKKTASFLLCYLSMSGAALSHM